MTDTSKIDRASKTLVTLPRNANLHRMVGRAGLLCEKCCVGQTLRAQPRTFFSVYPSHSPPLFGLACGWRRRGQVFGCDQLIDIQQHHQSIVDLCETFDEPEIRMPFEFRQRPSLTVV